MIAACLSLVWTIANTRTQGLEGLLSFYGNQSALIIQWCSFGARARKQWNLGFCDKVNISGKWSSLQLFNLINIDIEEISLISGLQCGYWRNSVVWPQAYYFQHSSF